MQDTDRCLEVYVPTQSDKSESAGFAGESIVNDLDRFDSESTALNPISKLHV